MDEAVAVLSVGSVVGGATPANRRWREAISELASAVSDSRASVSSPLNVNVVFQVPGDLVRPSFEGARTGRHSRAEDSW